MVGGFSALFLTLSVVGASAADYYVSTQGSDSSPGTSAQPFRTITHAYGLAGPGTTIHVLPGVYTDYTSGWGLHFGASGTASSPIIVKSEVKGGAVIDGQNASDRNEGIYIDGNYNVVDGFVITRAPDGGISIWSSGNQIRNNEIHHNGNPASTSTNGRDGVYSDQGTANNSYTANYIHDNGRTGSNLDHGLYLCGDNETVLNNVLIRNAGSGLQIAGYTTVSNMKVYNNVMAYNGTEGLILWMALSGVDFKNNILYGNGLYGIYSYDAHGSGVVFDHNLSYGNGSGNYTFSNGGSDYSYTVGTMLSVDPRFVNETSSGFDAHLGTGSPAIGAGLDLSSVFTTDMSGAARPASGAWDLAAYVHASADTTPPTVSVTAPASGATVSGSILVTASASDNVGVTGVQLKLDGANLGNAFSSAPYSGTLNTTTIANGSHTLTATAWDAAGNQATATPVTITVTNVTTPPLSLPMVRVVATVPTAVIGTTSYGALTFTRTGSTSSALTVNYTTGGTAVKWTDYRRPVTGDMPVSITIPAGASSYTMNIMGVTNSTGANPETASLTLSASSGYTVGSPSTATITIASSTVVTSPTALTFAATSGAISAPFITSNGAIYQTTYASVPSSGGQAVYSFSIATAGNYTISTMVNAPNDSANSFFVNIDAQPTDFTMICDVPITSGFASQTVSWRGNGTTTSNQFTPKVFTLAAGTHQLIVRGREANCQLSSITIAPH
jgi:hypothetical protein